MKHCVELTFKEGKLGDFFCDQALKLQLVTKTISLVLDCFHFQIQNVKIHKNQETYIYPTYRKRR